MSAQRLPDWRDLGFLDGTSHRVRSEVCRGCFMVEREPELPDVLTPVYDDGEITVRQDAEWPVPGFMVVGVRPHIPSLAEMPVGLALRLINVAKAVRTAQRDGLGISMAHSYQEDKPGRSHYHLWLLPLWPEILAEHKMFPRIYDSNIMAYIRLFDYRETEPDVRSALTVIGSRLTRE